MRIAKYLGIFLLANSVTFADTLSNQTLSKGFYAGLGTGLNSVTESFNSFLVNSTNKSASDHYDASANHLSPLIQIGYFAPLQKNWLWGFAVEWQNLNYKTENVNSSRGQYLPDATFSSINFFGPEVLRDFTSQTRVNNELLFLFSFGMLIQNGYAYFGVGPAFFTTANSIYVSSIHLPSGVGAHLTAGSVTDSQTVWGGAAQVGYNYFVTPTFFLNINYTYAQLARTNYGNTINSATLNGGSAPAPSTLSLNRSIGITNQEIMLSINKLL